MTANTPTPEKVYSTTFASWDVESRRRFNELIVENPNPEPAEGEGSPARFDVVWADSIDREPQPLEFLVENLITKGSVNLFFGTGGSKKTWLCLDMAVDVALGKPWLGRETEQTTVLIVDEESGPKRLRLRILKTLNGHLAPGWENVPLAYTSLSMIDLGDPDDINALHVLIEETGAGLVIIDALADVCPGRDENSVKDMQPVFHNLRALAESTDAAFLIIHHSNKQGGYRGSTAIQAACDLALEISSQPGNLYVDVKTEKARDIEPQSFTCKANFPETIDQFYLTETDAQPRTKAINKSQLYVLRYMIEHPEAVKDELMESADVCEPSTAKNALYNLVASGHAQRVDAAGTGRGVKAVYSLTDKGKELAKRELGEGE